MSCQITNNITTPCNRNQGGIRRIYLANGPLYAAVDTTNIITALLLDGSPTFTPVGPWYTIELPRVTGQFTETYEINQANGTVVYNQELSFVSNTWDTTTRERVIEMAQSTDMIVIFEDNNGKLWLMGEHHGVHMQTGTTESGLNYGDRNGHTIVLAARNPEPAQEVFEGAYGGPIDDSVDPGDLGSPVGNVFSLFGNMLTPPVYPEVTSRLPQSGWQSYYDTVTAFRQNTYWAGYQQYSAYFLNTSTPSVGDIAYKSDGTRLFLNGQGYVWRVNTSSSSTWKIIDYDNGRVTSIKNFSNYTCSIPDPLEGQGSDPYYKIYYGYEYLGVETKWTSDAFGYTNADAKAIIEAMPVGATPLYYKIIKTRGHVPIYDVTLSTIGFREGPYWPFPMQRHFTWNYDTNLRSDIPRETGYLFNHNNRFDLDPSEINVMFSVAQAASTPGGIYCPLVSGANYISPNFIDFYEAV